MTTRKRELFQNIHLAAGYTMRLLEVLSQCAEWLGADACHYRIDADGQWPPESHALPTGSAGPCPISGPTCSADECWTSRCSDGQIVEIFNTGSLPRASDSPLTKELLGSHILAGRLSCAQDGWEVICFHRNHVARPFSLREEAMAARLIPHIAWALKIHLQLEDELARTLKILDRPPEIAARIDESREVKWVLSRGVPIAGAAPQSREEQIPNQANIPALEELRRRFGLTLAEAKITMALAEGLGLKQIAGRFDISINTVRSHLAHAFGKTYTSRQAQLVRLILSLKQNSENSASGSSIRMTTASCSCSHG